jgi:RNA polymerase sigma-70 factor (ECF subfamily)
MASAEFVTQITREQRQLHAFVLSLVWNPSDADEVLQETNLALWEKAAEFDGSRPFARCC